MVDMYLPTIPYTVIDNVNRAAAATGSINYAYAASEADYNGHRVTVSFNDFRKYFITQYFWGERVVLCRGTLAECLRSGAEYYKRGSKGSCVRVNVPDDKWTAKDTEKALELGYKPWSQDIEAEDNAKWYTPLHSLAGRAVDLDRRGIPAIHILVTSSSAEEYEARLDEHYAKVREARGAITQIG